MILKIKGAVIDTMRDKRGTLYLIVLEDTEGKATPQKVRCYGRAIASAAQSVRIGDVVDLEARLSAKRWEPTDGREPTWFDGLEAHSIEVKASAPGKDNDEAPVHADDSELPF